MVFIFTDGVHVNHTLLVIVVMFNKMFIYTLFNKVNPNANCNAKIEPLC